MQRCSAYHYLCQIFRPNVNVQGGIDKWAMHIDWTKHSVDIGHYVLGEFPIMQASA